ncbi:FAD-dependent oxidoreductase [Erysipelotrichaceae bacterium RD49]|nr:FAD-dependent oxidoreductase [Erysipelotrichaceae bacterium RD49]
MYDTVIIGAGPAGISSAIYAKSRGKDVLVLDKKGVGGLIGNVSTVTHYTGIIQDETGKTFAKRMKEQAEGAGIEIRIEDVEAVNLDGDVKTIKTNAGEYEARTVIIANGGSPKMLEIPGENLGGMRLNAPKDGPDYAGKTVYVIGGADGAVKEALYLTQFAKKVVIVCIEDELICIPEFKNKVIENEKIEVIPHTSLTRVLGTDHLNELEFTDLKAGGKTTIIDPEAGVFVYAGIVPNTKLYPQLKLDDGGFIVVDGNMETSLPGVFAAGDIRAKKVRQVATAVSDGAIAGINAAAQC